MGINEDNTFMRPKAHGRAARCSAREAGFRGKGYTEGGGEAVKSEQTNSVMPNWSWAIAQRRRRDQPVLVE